MNGQGLLFCHNAIAPFPFCLIEGTIGASN
jgi:hypothetical protein